MRDYVSCFWQSFALDQPRQTTVLPDAPTLRNGSPSPGASCMPSAAHSRAERAGTPGYPSAISMPSVISAELLRSTRRRSLVVARFEDPPL